MMLDLESVRLFVLAADFGNLTRAAEVAGTVQPVVSQRIRALERQLGVKLLDRTPRYVRLTQAGAVFIEKARTLLTAHSLALDLGATQAATVQIGISDHLFGPFFDNVLRQLKMSLPSQTRISIRLGHSSRVREMFDKLEVDIALVRCQGAEVGGEILGHDPIDWHAASDWHRPEGPLPLILMSQPCGVREIATKILNAHQILWEEVFIGGSCLSLLAAVRAGLGVAPLGRIIGGRSELPLPPTFNLPSLPPSEVVMFARTADTSTSQTARILSSLMKSNL